MIRDEAKIDDAGHQRGEPGRTLMRSNIIESLVPQIADARRKENAQQPAHGKEHDARSCQYWFSVR